MLNEVRLIGNLASEPETGEGKGTAYTKFVVICNGRTESQKAVMPVTAFGKAAAHAAGLIKGQQVLVFGRLETSSWKTDEGQPRSKTSIIAEFVVPSESL